MDLVIIFVVLIKMLSFFVLIHALYVRLMEKKKYYDVTVINILLFIAIFSIMGFGVETYFFWIPETADVPKMGIVIVIALGLAGYLISLEDKAFKYDSDVIEKQIINEENERIHKYDEYTGNIDYLVELENEYSQKRDDIIRRKNRNESEVNGRLNAYSILKWKVSKKIARVKGEIED